MKPVVKKATPAAIAVLRQATEISPSRMKASDGLLPSKAHQAQNPNSDHNTGLAVDLTHDPARNIDCHEIYEQLKRDKRVKYLIFNKQIWIPGRGDKPYTGSNPHNKHLHISIKDNCGNDDSPWFPWLSKPKKTPKTITKVAISKVQKPKKKLVKTSNDKLRTKSLLTLLFKKGKK
jgi:hypothetical protein